MLSVRLKAKKKYRQLKRTLPEGDQITHLNITAMMDMMTILLIFFLKNFSVSAENISVSEDMRPPPSSSEVEPHSAVQVTVTKKSILVPAGDKNEQVAAVKNGEVDSSIKQGGASSYVITPLLAMLQKHATRLRHIEKITRGKQKFEGELVLVADEGTPYRLVSEVLYTAGQAEFGKTRLMVLKGRRAE